MYLFFSTGGHICLQPTAVVVAEEGGGGEREAKGRINPRQCGQIIYRPVQTNSAGMEREPWRHSPPDPHLSCAYLSPLSTPRHSPCFSHPSSPQPTRHHNTACHARTGLAWPQRGSRAESARLGKHPLPPPAPPPTAPLTPASPHTLTHSISSRSFL